MKLKNYIIAFIALPFMLLGILIAIFRIVFIMPFEFSLSVAKDLYDSWEISLLKWSQKREPDESTGK